MTDITDGPVPMDLRDPAELLSFVPYEFTFQPQDSLVIVSVTEDGDEHQLGQSARISLEGLTRSMEGRDLQRRVISALRNRGLAAGFLIVYNQPFFELLASPTRSDAVGEEETVMLAQHIMTWFDYDYFHPERTFVVGDEAWRCLTCATPDHCPPGGRMRSELKYTAVAASMVVRGEHFRDRREDLVLLPDSVPPGTLTTPVQALMRSIQRRRRRILPTAQWLVDSTKRWNDFLFDSDHRPEPAAKAMLALSLYSVKIRDNVIFGICTNNPVPDPIGGDDHFSTMFKGVEAPREEQLQRAKGKLHDLASHCPPDLREPILSVWAWCAWWGGYGAEAGVLIDLALETMPDYSLALTLRSVANTGALPPWKLDQEE